MALKVLMAEDDESIQMIVRLGLVDLGGMDLVLVNNGKNAFDYLKDNFSTWQPDLIITDVNMPIMDGPELLKELKSDEKLQEIPIIFLSAEDGNEIKKALLLSGAIDVIPKPFDPLVLAELINKIFEKYKTELNDEA